MSTTDLLPCQPDEMKTRAARGRVRPRSVHRARRHPGPVPKTIVSGEVCRLRIVDDDTPSSSLSLVTPS